VGLQDESLDRERWLALWSRLGARGTGASVFGLLSAAYSEPGRVYHNAGHILDCLSELDRARDLPNSADEVEAGLWFHDTVYRAGAPNNEALSAELAQRTCSEAGISDGSSNRIKDLILATRHDSVPMLRDEQIICDIDLAILGREPDAFDRFEHRVRREYAWVPEPVYRRERSAVLSAFLRRPSIYQIDRFRDRYEAAARSNLKRLIARLA
jgi:predicted metal-dependent HD superfamily phosphohydrolase